MRTKVIWSKKANDTKIPQSPDGNYYFCWYSQGNANEKPNGEKYCLKKVISKRKVKGNYSGSSAYVIYEYLKLATFTAAEVSKLNFPQYGYICRGLCFGIQKEAFLPAISNQAHLFPNINETNGQYQSRKEYIFVIGDDIKMSWK